jgi:hypothetical protein
MKISEALIGLVAILSMVFSVVAVNRDAQDVISNLGGVTNFDSLTLSEDLIVGDDVSISGDTVMSNDLQVDEIDARGTLNLSVNRSGIIYGAEPITGTTTLTSSYGNYITFPASADQITVTLPAVTATGSVYSFVVTGALTGASVTIDSAEGDNINGILMVNDTDVACDGEDQLNIVTDGEVIGDRVELLSIGSGWVLLDSDIDAAGKMTCTDPS